MSVKRSSSTNLTYPLKKRAVIEQCYGNKLSDSTTGCYDNKQSDGCYDNKQSDGCYDNKQSDVTVGKEQISNFPTESDSLSSTSSNDIADPHLTQLSVARETSPVSEHSPPDYQTPERNPLSSRNNYRQISKPLFPYNDNESLISNSNHGNHRNIPDWRKLNYSNHRDSSTGPNIPHSVESIVEKYQFTNISRQNTAELSKNISRQNSVEYLTHKRCENNKVGAETTEIPVEQVAATQTVRSSPIVSLLSKFNTEELSDSTRKTNSNCDTRLPHLNQEVSLPNPEVCVPNPEVCVPNPEVRVPNPEVRVPNKTLSVQQDSNNLSNHGNRGNLGRSVESVNKLNKFACKLCGLTFPSQSQLVHHSKEHRGIIQCWKCSEEFASAERLNLHMKMEHKGENPYKCETCSREFTQYNNLRRHQRVHRENLYKCNLCDREFNEEFYLKMHMGTHTGSRVYSCGVCRAEFPSNHDLKMHVKTHSPSLLHTCNVCGKSFSKACVLRQHRKCHSGQRPHKCTVCDKTFIHRHHLTMHMKSHTEEEKRAAQNAEPASRGNNNTHADVNPGKTILETDPNSLKEMNKENIKPNSGSGSGSTPALSGSQKPNITCNKNLAKQFVNIPQNPHSDVHVSVKHTSHKRGRKKSAAQNQIPELAQYNGHSLSQPICRETVSAGYMPNTTYGYHPQHQTSLISHASRPMQHTPHSSHPMMPGAPMFPTSINPYGHLYKHYSEQMQAYVNNMYMMSFLSQNAMLPSFQGQGHPGFQSQGQSQLPTGKNLHMQDQCYATIPNQGQLLQGQGQLSQGQQSSSQGHEIKIQGQIDSRMNEQSSENDEETTKDIKPCIQVSTLEDSTSCLEVVSKNENFEVYVFKGNDFDKDDDATQTSHEDDGNAKFIDKSDEHEIAEEMIKMSTGVWPGTIHKQEGTNLKMSAVEEGTSESQETADVPDDVNPDLNELKSRDTPDSDSTGSTKVCQLDVEPATACEIRENETVVKDHENCVEISVHKLKNSSETEDGPDKVYKAGERESGVVSSGESENKRVVSSGKGENKRVIPFCNMEVNEIKLLSRTKDNDDNCLVNKVTDVETISKHVEKETITAMIEDVIGSLKPNSEADKLSDKLSDNSKNNLVKHNTMSDIPIQERQEIKAKVNETIELETKDMVDQRSEQVSHSKLVNKEVAEITKLNDMNQRSLSRDMVTHTKVDKLGHISNVRDTGAMDLRTKLRCDDYVATISVTDENMCAPLNLKVKRKLESPRKSKSPKKSPRKSVRNSKSPRKSKSPRDFYVIKRSDVLKDCSEQSYVMDAREFQNHLNAHNEDRLNEIQAKWENHGSNWENFESTRWENRGTKCEKSWNVSMNGSNTGRNRNKSSPARCVLKPMDMNSPPHDRMFTDKRPTNHVEDTSMLYKCPECSRSFAHKHNLTRHQMSHNNTKTYGCDICGRHFKEQFYLQMHMKVHTEETKRQCEVCGQNVLKSEFVDHTKEHFRCITENPTYTQISDRVRELLHVQKSSQQVINNELFLYDHITNIPNMKGSLDELAQLMRLTKSGHDNGVVPLDDI